MHCLSQSFMDSIQKLNCWSSVWLCLDYSLHYIQIAVILFQFSSHVCFHGLLKLWMSKMSLGSRMTKGVYSIENKLNNKNHSLTSLRCAQMFFVAILVKNLVCSICKHESAAYSASGLDVAEWIL